MNTQANFVRGCSLETKRGETNQTRNKHFCLCCCITNLQVTLTFVAAESWELYFLIFVIRWWSYVRKVCQSYTSEEIFVRRKKIQTSLVCINVLITWAPLYLFENRFLIGPLPRWSPLIGYCLQIRGPILQYYCLYQLCSVATSLSNSNIWQKIEIKQIIAGFVEPESFPTLISWYNLKTVYPEVGPNLFKVLLRWHDPPSPLVSHENVSDLSA